MPKELTTNEVANTLNITPRRDWAIKPEDLELVKVRKPGRPRLEELPELCDAETTVVFIRRR